MEYVAIDCETTGLESKLDRIVELACVRFNDQGEELSYFQTLINPGCHIPEEVSSIHGITDSDVADSPSFSDILSELFEFLHVNQSSTVYMAHNAGFDVSFINQEIIRSLKQGNILLYQDSFDVIDSIDVIKRKHRFFRSYSLPNMITRFNLQSDGHHRALADCHSLRRLWMHIEESKENLYGLKRYRIKNI
jgi:DNA polymerase III subunit epsilon